MKFINDAKPVKVSLARDLVRTIKRGHAWVYREALRDIPRSAPGTPAMLYDRDGKRAIAQGYLDPDGPLALRICQAEAAPALDDQWARTRMQSALELRKALFDGQTTGYRLFNGEGDGLPGLVCDVYGEWAVLKLDGPAAEGFWRAEGIAGWLDEQLSLKGIVLRQRGRGGKTAGLAGRHPDAPVAFLENGVHFTADLLEGQKTGFFLDQRDNRARVRPFSAGKRVLNVFGYTGGFSVLAGLGGALKVVTVDTAAAALEAAQMHWEINGLDRAHHETAAEDAFEFLERVEHKGAWDVVILDPPSFAPSEAAVQQAVPAYTRLITLGASACAPGGLLAAASCSSHVGHEQFVKICEQAISGARRRATVLGIHGQPPDHPSPLVMPELRYLKFVLMRLDG